MKRLAVLGIVALSLFGCTKDKFKTVPQVEIKSLSPDPVYKGQLFTLSAIVRDKEGDLKDTVLIVRKRFNNTTLLTVDTLRYSISDFAFPKNNEIEIQAVFSYGEIRDNYIFQNPENADRNF